ncbi:MAG: nicotinamide-nucleotide amidohydrolase family protein, partial [Spirochaetia bacterium]|nr:nicotinamide-nucleotide amidohydrolase family protein [Spirochaetia bacterium]
NASFMARLLTAAGFRVTRILALPDIKEVIGECAIKSPEDVLLFSGGLGPTPDDLTAEAFAEAFGVNMMRSEKEAARITEFFRVRNRPMPELTLRQALHPEGFEALPNPVGTAPALYKNGRPVLFAMPGVPREMRAIMETHVIPILKKTFPLSPIHHYEIQTVGIGESSIYEIIKDLPVPKDVTFAYLPEAGKVLLRWSGTDERQLKSVGKPFKARLKAHVLSDQKENLQEVIQNRFIKKKWKLGTAESLTGGLISASLTEIPGSSAYLDCGLTTYSNESKVSLLGVKPATLKKHGAVSEAVVREMAFGLIKKRKLTSAIAVSGIAGPDGGSKEKPVGTVWIATAFKKEIVCRLHHFRGDRGLVRERTLTESLLQLWKMLP